MVNLPLRFLLCILAATLALLKKKKTVFLLRSLHWLLIACRTKALILAKEALNSWPQPPLSLPSTSPNHTPLNALHFHTSITPLPGVSFCSSITISGKKKKENLHPSGSSWTSFIFQSFLTSPGMKSVTITAPKNRYLLLIQQPLTHKVLCIPLHLTS